MSYHVVNHSCIALLFILCLSCKKIGHGYVKGTVTENGTGTPIPGATVILQHWKDNCSKCSYMFDSTYADSQGNYIMYFTKQPSYLYHLFFRDNQHYGYSYWITEKKSEYDAALDPACFLRFRIRKLKSSENNLNIYVYGSTSGIGYKSDHPVDSLLPQLYRFRPGMPVSASWNIFSATESTKSGYSGSLSIQPKDTLVYTVEYD